jgi:thiamine-phosphate diphosphorylase
LKGLFVLADDDPRWPRDPVEQARAACDGGASVVQLRAKQSTDEQIMAWAGEIRRLTRDSRTLLFVNDRFDLALAADADGVHLGQEDLPPDQVPPGVRKRLLVGRSTHTLDQVRAACAEPIDYVAFGPVFETGSKRSSYDARGPALLAEAVVCAGSLPVIAIGGIDAKNAGEVTRAGAAGAAVISAVAGADDCEQAVRDLSRTLERSSAQ